MEKAKWRMRSRLNKCFVKFKADKRETRCISFPRDFWEIFQIKNGVHILSKIPC